MRDPCALSHNDGRFRQRATLDLLSHLRIDRNKIKLEDGSYVTSGAFGDVHRGTLRLGWFKIRERPSIAVKKLRPAGDSKQRLRVAAVRNHSTSIALSSLTCLIG